MSRSETLSEGQKLVEVWRIEYEPMPLAHRGPDRVRGRMVWWPHATHYASSVEAPDIHTARLQIVLGQARAICDDALAFKYDEDNIHNANMLAWFNGKLQELHDEEDAEGLTVKRSKQLDREIRLLERLVAEWQEEHDYWPEEDDAPGSEATRAKDKRTAALAVSRAAAEAVRSGGGED